MEIFLINFPLIRIVLQLVLAALLGGLLGLERNYMGKEAGVRTFALISLGACLFTMISVGAFQQFLTPEGIDLDPSRIAAQIVTGIGFLGMAVVFRRGSDIEGLTTAASIWVSAALGMAVGVGWFKTALVAMLIAFSIQGLLRMANLEYRLSSWHEKRQKNAKKS